MTRFRLLHHHGPDRVRQLRWVLPLTAVLLGAVAAVLVVQYRVSDEAVTAEFFRAHKTIGHTGELLQRGLVAGGAVLLLAVLGIALWAFRLTHGIVAPVHTLQRALDALAGGDLGVRVELRRGGEFQEIGVSLNRLVEEFSETLGRVHALAGRIESAAGAAAEEARDDSAEWRLYHLAAELDRTLEFFRLEPRRTIGEDDTTSLPPRARRE